MDHLDELKAVVGKTITLNAEDAFAAAGVVTCQMLRKHTHKRTTDSGGFSKSKRGQSRRWGDGFAAAMSEIAVSRLLNKAWTGGGVHISHGDVGKVEVRHTEYPSGHLLIYKSDDDLAPVVLLIGGYPEFIVAGCMMVGDGKRKEWWRSDSDPPAYWVPQGSDVGFWK